ncbi:MAG: galactokinase [Desulfobacter sp.]|nr:galactokinase [Desulfobacter sp.]
MNFKPILDRKRVKTSVPCRVDLGGTLDISTFFIPLARVNPATFNLALDLRTCVTLSSFTRGRIKISSKGFATIERDRDENVTDNPMGLMFAIAKFFNAHGLHIHIESSSPPKSALGGSSSAAVALIAGFYTALGKSIDPEQIAWLAHYIESAVAGVPCGMQDQTAAAFGGVNLWEWKLGKTGPQFIQTPLYKRHADIMDLNRHILVAFCGITHVSADVNSRWVAGFKSGDLFAPFEQIVKITRDFSQALMAKEYDQAGKLMNKETRLRCEMTPDVLDKTGQKMFESAVAQNCGARFTGAGAGGCLWAVGEEDRIQALSLCWQKLFDNVETGSILATRIDTQGICVEV